MRHKFGLAVIASVFAFVFACAGLVAANAETARPDDSHIVVLYRDGVEQTVLTRAENVGALIDKLQIKLGESDLIEPSLTTEINADNFKIRIFTAEPTTIIYDGKETSLLSPYINNREAVQKAGINLAPEDGVELDYSGSISESKIIGRKLLVRRAINVNVVLYGAQISRKTLSKNVSGILKEMNIKPGPSDVISPDLETPIATGTTVFITKQGVEVQALEESIPFTSEVREDAAKTVSYIKTIQAGVNGKKYVFYELNKTTNEKTKILETVVAEAIGEVIVKGTKTVFASYNTDGIPARVFCGSPKQGNWKNINVANAAIGKALADERGWTGAEFDALLELFACESSWNERAGNPYSGAYGIPQSWPANKMASFGEDYETNPLTQLRWGLNYIAARYGTPSKALAFHYRTNYY